MSDHFTMIQNQVFRHYHDRTFKEALALLDNVQNTVEFPAQMVKVVYWRACILCLLQRPDDAIQALQDGLENGLWWSEGKLRNDTDLQSLQGNLLFDAVIDACNLRRQQAEASARSLGLVSIPALQRDTFPLAMVLHGYDSNAAETLPIWSPLSEHGWLVAALQSSQLVGMDGYQWADGARTYHDVEVQMQELASSHPITAGCVMIGGFSNGGRAALTLALKENFNVQYVVSVAGALTDDSLANLDWRSIHAKTLPHILLIVGEVDNPVQLRIQEQAHILSSNGLDVSVQIIPALGHRPPDDLPKRVPAWLSSR